jgi:hypothetical protein
MAESGLASTVWTHCCLGESGDLMALFLIGSGGLKPPNELAPGAF